MSRKKTTELLNLLRAKDPLIYVETYEEDEFVVDLCDIVSKMHSDPNNKYNVPPRIFTYTRTTGLYSINLSNPLHFDPSMVVEDIHTVNQALEYIRSIQCGLTKTEDPLKQILNKNNNQDQNKADIKGPAIFVFKDLHMYMSDKDVIRFLRDCKEAYFNNNYCPIIVTSPVVDIPVELEKLFTYWSYPLMDKDEIAESLGCYLNGCFYTEDEKRNIITACCGLTSREILKAFMHSAANNKDKQVRAEDIYNEKIQMVKKSGCIDYIEPHYNINDLGGCDNFKKWMKKVKEATSPEAKAFGIPFPKGAMLVGVPGTSKSASAEILAAYLKVPLLSLQMSKIMGSFVGQSERAIANALRIANAISPCVLLMDEIEKNLGGYSSSNNCDGGTLSRVVGQILNFLQEDSNVIVMMTSNDVSQLPPELTRSGRIDTQWMFDLPNTSERKEIANIYLDKNGLIADREILNLIVDKTENFTGAEIKSAIKDMLINAYYRQKDNDASDINKILTASDVNSAVNDTVTVWKSSKEKIEAFRHFAKGRYLNASKTEEELKKERLAPLTKAPGLHSRTSPLKTSTIFKL